MRTTATVIVAVCAVGCIASAVQAQSIRHARSNGAPIASQVRPTDDRLILESVDPPPMVLIGEFGTHLDMMTDLAHAILLIRIEPVKRPELNDRGSWIRSRVTARVDGILKPNSMLRASEGDLVSFHENSGTVQIGRTVVEAVVPWAMTFQPGKRYLVFCAVSPDGELIVAPNASYEEHAQGRAARRMMKWPSEWLFDEIEVMGIEAAAVAIVSRLQSR